MKPVAEIKSTLKLSPELCIGCGLCTQVCPHAVFALEHGLAVIRRREACMECGACQRNCPVAAIQVETGVGCAAAMIWGALTGREPSCGCGGAEKPEQAGSKTCC